MNETLRVQLTDAERIAKGEELARINFALAELEELKGAATRSFGNKIKALKLDGGKVAYDMQTGTEERSVDCVERPDWKDFVVAVIRTDTGELVRRRPMTHAERQLRFNAFTASVKEEDDEPGPPEEPAPSTEH